VSAWARDSETHTFWIQPGSLTAQMCVSWNLIERGRIPAAFQVRVAVCLCPYAYAPAAYA